MRLLYFYGQGVAQDYTEAVIWFCKAAEQGHAKARNKLGRIYDSGEGLAQNYTQAAAWYRKAAEQGLIDAQFDLAQKYEKGEGVAQDWGPGRVLVSQSR